jgi:DNA-3-methyladenine glycosylase I
MENNSKLSVIGDSKKAEKTRCWWCGDDPLYVAYHDQEWGVPVRGDRELFELLVLEGFQAGLSWITILRKRENFRKAFLNFHAERIARFGEKDFARLMGDAGIVRNRLKVTGSALNAQAFLKVQEEEGSFSKFIWGFTGGKTWRDPAGMDRSRMRAKSEESDAMSKALLKRGFKFVGSTICYAFMQASGMVDDHMVGCWKYKAR